MFDGDPPRDGGNQFDDIWVAIARIINKQLLLERAIIALGETRHVMPQHSEASER